MNTGLDVGLPQDRAVMEERFGFLGTGQQAVMIRNRVYLLHEILEKIGLAYEDVKPIDAFDMGDGRFAIRYFDFEERLIVVYEFEDNFKYLQHIKSHIAEWMGEEEYWNFGWGVWCPWTL